ncbi:hypothetical protein NVP1208B_61 [Vibrio phage 1.208.B._10N.222.52.A7]|nr:hypothetical protein NVP1208B_61 [Vibrio phage 1.208.B._10N.222.52.A7]
MNYPLRVILTVGVVALVCSTASEAKTTSLEVLGGGWSYHYDRNNQNESHNIAGLCYKRICAASFTNSHSERSILSYYYHPFLQGGWWSLQGKVGIMGGYEGHVDERYEVGGFMPMVGLGVSVKAFTIDSTDVWLDATITPVVTMFNVRVSL